MFGDFKNTHCHFLAGSAWFCSAESLVPLELTRVVLNTTLPHNLIKEKLLDLIEWTFKRALKTVVHFIWPVMTEKLFSLPLTKIDIQLEFRWVQIAAIS